MGKERLEDLVKGKDIKEIVGNKDRRIGNTDERVDR